MQAVDQYMETIYGMAKVTTTGYRHDSPDVGNRINLIPGNRISMKGVKFKVIGIDNTGDVIVMDPEQEYQFAGDYVIEIPVRIACR